jgi:6-pyruvoyltetrahydropterin/6-carboxytetrahydropterin synthase
MNITRELDFEAAHRITRHESKCAHPHGHHYKLEVTCSANQLDYVGRIIDFSEVKAICGGWIDEHIDHGTILFEADGEYMAFLHQQKWKHYVIDCEPTVENLSRVIFNALSRLLEMRGVRLEKVKLYETPRCWAEYP